MPQGRDALDELADEVYAGQATAVDELDAAADEVYGNRRDLKFARPPKKKGVIRQAAEDIARGAKIEGREFVGSAMRITGGALQHGEKLAEKAGIAGTGVRQLGALGRTLEEKAPEVKGDSFLGAAAGSTLALGVPAMAAVAAAPVASVGAGASAIAALTMGGVGVLATGYQEGRAAEARAKAAGANPESQDRAYWDAATSGWTIASGASEGILGWILGNANVLTGGRLKGVLGNLIFQAGEEGVTGYAQEFASLVNENTTAEEKRTIRQILAQEQARLLRAGLAEAIAVTPLTLLHSAVGWKPAKPADAGRTLDGRSADGPDAIGGAVDAESGRSADGPRTLAGRSTDAAAGTPTAPAGVAPLAQEPPVGQGAAPLPSPETEAVGPEPIAPRSGPRPLISELEERYADQALAPLPEGSVEAESGEQAVARVGRELREAAREPPIEPGMVRLYRGETDSKPTAVSDWVKESEAYKGTVAATGRWFSRTREEAQYYVDHFGEQDGRLSYIDVPAADVEKYMASKDPEAARFSATGRAEQEFFVPKELAAQRRALPQSAALAEAARALEASQEKRPLTRGDRARRAPTTRSELMQSLEEAADAARERIKGRGLRMYAGVDPAELKDELIVATNYVAKGVVKFADFAKEMVREFGESIRPHLRKLFVKARGNAQSEFPETNPAFRKWFGESKVVDEEGFPRVVYHGTPNGGFTAFEKAGLRDTGWFGEGFNFSEDKATADAFRYTTSFRKTGRAKTYAVHLAIQNPLRIGDIDTAFVEKAIAELQSRRARFGREPLATERVESDLRAPMLAAIKNKNEILIAKEFRDSFGDITNYAKAMGYDGIYSKAEGGTWVAFNPTQIKSATGNRGTYDPEDPTLMHAGLSTPEVGAMLKRFTGMPTETDTGSLVPPVQTGAQRTRQEVQAAMEPFERAAKSSGRKEFQTVAERATTYQDRAAYAWGKIREGQVEPLLETVKEVGEDKAQAYLYARHATDANKVTRERTEGAKDAGSGMTDEQAATIIQAAESGPHAGRFKALGRRWDALMQQNLDMMVQYKLITPETATRLKAMYPHYVPLKTLMDEGERQAMGIGKGADIRGPEFKVRLGRNTVADAPLAHGLAALQRTLIRGEKRRMLQPLVDLLAEEGGEIPGFVKLRRSNLIEDLPRNVVGLGPDLRLEFEPEYQDFVDAIQNPTGRGIDQRTLLGAITKHVGKLVRTVGGLATRHNPVFPIINALFRDPATAFFISAEHGLAFGVRVVKDGPKAWLAMFGNGSWAKHAETYRSLGGQMATLGMDDVQGHMENIQKLLAEPGTFKRGARALVRGLQTYADAGENAMRLSAFVHAQEDLGMSAEDAVFYAKNLTTNFRRKGLAGNYINAWWLFANPGIQGTHRAGQVAGNKNVQKLVGSAVAMSAIMDLINRMASDEDDDGVRFYDAIPEYVKRHNMLFTFDGRRYFKIPLPPIFNWFHALGTNLSEEGWDHWVGEDLSGSFVGDMAVAAMDSFNPLGGSDNALSILSPTPTDPAVELAFNEDFAGRSIAKLPFPGQQSPPSEQYWPDVNPTVEAITTKLNEWTGGDKYEAGKVSINPEWVEHLGKFLGSGAGQFLGQLYDIPDKMLRGEPVTSADIPLVRRLVQDPSPYALGGRYRDARDEVKLATKRTEGEPGPPTDKDRPLWALKSALSSTEKQINAKEEKLAKATSPKLKAKLEAEIREIQAKFTRRVHEAKESARTKAGATP